MNMRNKLWTPLLLLWGCGACLRLTILAVPPVISIIQHDLHLTGTEIGLLTGIPVVLLAIAASLGSALVGRFGIRSTVLTGLFVTALGGALRAISSNTWELYLTTGCMGLGVAILQPSMAAAVRSWMPSRATFATALYTNGLIAGEILPVALTLPLVLPLVGTWRLALAAWSLPLIVTLCVAAVLIPRSSSPISPRHHMRLLPDLGSCLNWRIGMCLGTVASTYFCVNGFLPGYLIDRGHPELVSIALTAMNLGQAPASITLLFIADKVQGKRWAYVVPGLMMAACVIGIIHTSSWWTVLFAGVLGTVCAWALSMSLSLPPMLCRNPDDVARTSAGAFAVGYGFSVLISYLAGVAWDIADSIDAAFIPILFGTLPVVIVAPLLLRKTCIDHPIT
jgi:CP family cyanate transporter-like MFS transporter